MARKKKTGNSYIGKSWLFPVHNKCDQLGASRVCLKVAIQITLKICIQYFRYRDKYKVRYT